jgi:hypothetical protein
MVWRTSFVLVLKGGDQVKASRGSRPSLRVCRRGRYHCSAAVPGIWYASRRRHDGRSGRAPFVPIMQATDLRDRRDGALVRWRDSPRNRRIFAPKTSSGFTRQFTPDRHLTPDVRLKADATD